MTDSVNTVNPHMKFTPNQKVVVYPPARVYKYSMYDDLRLGEDNYSRLVKEIKEPSPGNKRLKTEITLKNILGLVMLAGIGILGYKNRSWIGQQIKKIPHLIGMK